jgi:hypothetical protein
MPAFIKSFPNCEDNPLLPAELNWEKAGMRGGRGAFWN